MVMIIAPSHILEKQKFVIRCLPFLLWCQPDKHRNPPLNSMVMIIAPSHILEKQKFVISS